MRRRARLRVYRRHPRPCRRRRPAVVLRAAKLKRFAGGARRLDVHEHDVLCELLRCTLAAVLDVGLERGEGWGQGASKFTQIGMGALSECIQRVGKTREFMYPAPRNFRLC